MLIGFIKGALLMLLFFVSSLPASVDNGANSWYQMGYNYSQQGENVKAFEWMLKAANNGHIAAQNNIGLSYLHGLGVEEDKQKAFEWFKKSAEQGLPYAQSELAMLYYQQGDAKKAQQWWLIAANANDEYAQFNLASLFLEQNNLKKSHYWFQRARNNNHPQAHIALNKLRE